MAEKTHLGLSSKDSERVDQVLTSLVAMVTDKPDLRLPLTADGDVLDAIAYGINILADELTFSRQRIEREREAAEAANRAKSFFLASMSHEIRTPLSAIIGFSELMMDAQLADRHKDFQHKIFKNGVALKELVDKILDLSKVESGELTISMAPVGVCQKILDCITGLEPQARKKFIRVSAEFNGQLVPVVETDGLRLWQVVNNLLSNAIKFTPAHGTITVEVGMNAEPPQLTIEVSDTGQGISAADQERLFQPYFQTNNPTRVHASGTGLGLALSRGICRALGGDLMLMHSGLAAGSTFKAVVPVKPLPGHAAIMAADAKVTRGSISSQPAVLLGYRILLAEDSEDSAILISTALKAVGARIDVVTDGSKTLPLADAVDVILMDIQMPTMDGMTATQTLRQRGCRTPIIALTAHAMENERKACLAMGFTDYMSKPVHWPALLESIRNHAQPGNKTEIPL